MFSQNISEQGLLRKVRNSRNFLLWVVQFSLSVVSDSLRPHESQHARPPCPSPTPGVHPNPFLFSQWCHPTILSSVVPFSSCPQSFPASGSFQISQLFTPAGQSIGVSASTSVLPMNTQDWSPLRWTGWISVTIVMIIKHPSKPYSVLNALHTYINSFNSHNNPMVCVLLLLPLYEWHNCSEIRWSVKGTTSRWYPEF